MGDGDPQRGDDDRDRVRVRDPEGKGDRRGAGIQRLQAGEVRDDRERLGLDALPRVPAGTTAPAGSGDGAHPEEVPADGDRGVGRRRTAALPSAAVEPAFGSRCRARSPETKGGICRGAHGRRVREDHRRGRPRPDRTGALSGDSPSRPVKCIGQVGAIVARHIRGVRGCGGGQGKAREAGKGLQGNARVSMSTVWHLARSSPGGRRGHGVGVPHPHHVPIAGLRSSCW